MSHGSAGRDWPARLAPLVWCWLLSGGRVHIQLYLMGRVSLVNQVVGVQGQGEQRHGKDWKFELEIWWKKFHEYFI